MTDSPVPPRHFLSSLDERNPDRAGRRWIYAPYDQLTDRVGPLAESDPDECGIVLIENRWKAARRPYHRMKLALVLANQRSFALEQAERGVAVRYAFANSPYRDALAPIAKELGPLRVMRPAERELRVDLAPLVQAGSLELVTHAGWMTDRATFDKSQGDGPPWRMDAFYRHVRRSTGILMDDDGKPIGGKFSFDAENREPWSGDPPAPEPPTFDTEDPLKIEIAELIEAAFSHHPGAIDLADLPASAHDAQRLWSFALEECLPTFGPYEDAMSTKSSTLFHTRVSPLVNLLRLLPADLVADVRDAKDLPLASREGFIRQLLGWREFVRHVHEATDGFRNIDGKDTQRHDGPGDGGFETWSGASWSSTSREAEATSGDEDPGSPAAEGSDDFAAPAHLDAHAPLPPAFWGSESGLACLDHVVEDVWRDAWGHHITRLMVLGNIATLLGVSARELTDWFWVAYADAYDWVVEPNVIGMASFAAGDVMTTKPYVSGANYIHKMSDYCASCRFHPKKTCPLTPMYWAFLARNRDHLDGNHRLRVILASLRKRSEAKKDLDRRTFEYVAEALGRGDAVEVDDLPAD